MAQNVIGQAGSGEKKILDNVHTVGDVKRALGCQEGYTALVNREPAEDSEELNDGDFVTLAKAVKGGS